MRHRAREARLATFDARGGRQRRAREAALCAATAVARDIETGVVARRQLHVVTQQ